MTEIEDWKLRLQEERVILKEKITRYKEDFESKFINQMERSLNQKLQVYKAEIDRLKYIPINLGKKMEL